MIILCLKSIGVWYELIVLERSDKSIGVYIGQIAGKLILVVAFAIAVYNIYQNYRS